MRIIGVMSGTSVDAIDVAIAEINGSAVNPANPLQVRQLFFVTIPWPTPVRAQIFDLFQGPTTAAALCQANFTLGVCFAQAVLSALDQAGISATEIDLIGSHGQTIWHDVQDGRVTSTLQIGEPAVIAAQTGITTVGNFRVADVAAGGQGAPLVSTFDWYLLRPAASQSVMKDGWRAVQNIGGIGNVTFLPPIGSDATPLAFDTGPGNALIDWAARLATNGRQQYDVDGRLAAAGQVEAELLAHWLKLPYFQQAPPKTTGRELFSQRLAEAWRREALAMGLSDSDFVATLTELTAASIALAYQQFAPGVIDQVVVGGGGARNPILLSRLRHQLQIHFSSSLSVCTHVDIGIDDKAKEALAFALLAYLAIHGWPGNVPTCTGANHLQILGLIAPGVNYNIIQQNVRDS